MMMLSSRCVTLASAYGSTSTRSHATIAGGILCASLLSTATGCSAATLTSLQMLLSTRLLSSCQHHHHHHCTRCLTLHALLSTAQGCSAAAAAQADSQVQRLGECLAG